MRCTCKDGHLLILEPAQAVLVQVLPHDVLPQGSKPQPGLQSSHVWRILSMATGHFQDAFQLGGLVGSQLWAWLLLGMA